MSARKSANAKVLASLVNHQDLNGGEDPEDSSSYSYTYKPSKDDDEEPQERHDFISTEQSPKK
jgi:hypothetical protein